MDKPKVSVWSVFSVMAKDWRSQCDRLQRMTDDTRTRLDRLADTRNQYDAHDHTRVDRLEERASALNESLRQHPMGSMIRVLGGHTGLSDAVIRETAYRLHSLHETLSH